MEEKKKPNVMGYVVVYDGPNLDYSIYCSPEGRLFLSWELASEWARSYCKSTWQRECWWVKPVIKPEETKETKDGDAGTETIES